MGKGANNLSASDLTISSHEPPPKTLISWEEIQKHNKKDDCWIVVNNIVYNVTNFKKKHPGGYKIIEFYAGQDATEVFNAFHKDFELVYKYAKAYQIGQIDPNDQSRLKLSDEEKQKIQREIEIREDFKQVKKAAEDMGLFKPSYTFYVFQFLQVVFLQMLSYYLFFNYAQTSYLGVLLALVCNFMSKVQAGWSQHDYGHSSLLAKPRHNKYIHLFFMGLIKGGSSDWWMHMHNLHHAKPNVIGKDPDIRLEPFFVVGTVEPVRRAENNVKKKVQNVYPFTIQQYIFPLGGPFLVTLLFQWATFYYVIKKRKYLDLISMIPMYIIHFTVTYTVFQSVIKCFAFYFFMRFFEGGWFTWISQCNHIVMDVHDDDEYDSWLQLQIRGTCNMEKSWFNDWCTGHLNFQIEHHLFPTMPRHNLYKIQPLVQSLCKKHGINYIVKPLWGALFDILVSLKKSGQLWQEAYDEIMMSI